ncbi:hypothetical protein STRMA_1654 [Streptococcus macacae NCTC 11558]|uniref:Uncharacterized protein n=1 Tax=Streptococcus macacae NCTC 11558 TaxID=764298 RepID=G5JXN0_9STRE|nr:hypothetical protein STRMA_1654 [Streptococcus macacae NCTC 11558]
MGIEMLIEIELGKGESSFAFPSHSKRIKEGLKPSGKLGKKTACF